MPLNSSTSARTDEFHLVCLGYKFLFFFTVYLRNLTLHSFAICAHFYCLYDILLQVKAKVSTQLGFMLPLESENHYF